MKNYPRSSASLLLLCIAIVILFVAQSSVKGRESLFLIGLIAAGIGLYSRFEGKWRKRLLLALRWLGSGSKKLIMLIFILSKRAIRAIRWMLKTSLVKITSSSRVIIQAVQTLTSNLKNRITSIQFKKPSFMHPPTLGPTEVITTEEEQEEDEGLITWLGIEFPETYREWGFFLGLLLFFAMFYVVFTFRLLDGFHGWEVFFFWDSLLIR